MKVIRSIGFTTNIFDGIEIDLPRVAQSKTTEDFKDQNLI
jgi:hypothetical protein